MIIAVFRMLFNLRGWKIAPNIPEKSSHCIMLAAPHTSNWDLVYAIAALDMLGIKVRFTIKKELNRFPLGAILKSMGALWIDRSAVKKDPSVNMTDIMAGFFSEKENQQLAMLVTAEGTRSLVTKWKTGFYYTALKANVPICLSYLDYAKKEAGIGICFMPSGSIEADLKIVMDFYKSKTARFPDKFATDERYS